MAKDKNKTQGSPATITTDNVMDSIRRGNLMTQVLTKEVEKQINDEKDERLKEELKGRLLKASYRRLSKLLQLRARRRESDITLESVQKSEILEDLLKGFTLTEEKIKRHGGKDGVLEMEVIVNAEGKKEKQTFKLEEGKEIWVPASITMLEFDKMSDDLVSDARKKRTESDNQLDKETKELQLQYPGYFRYSWNW